MNKTLADDGLHGDKGGRCDPSLKRPDRTAELTRGAFRLFSSLGLAVIEEFSLPTGRRLDLAGLGEKGALVAGEVKSCLEDYESDTKWQQYLEFCDSFYFVVSEDFPTSVLPESEGLIIADRYGGAIIRPSNDRKLAPARRKALTLRFARQAARKAFVPQ
ncbi:MAG: MmcB family DNA repair protein [Pseudomonadota bacterium]